MKIEYSDTALKFLKKSRKSDQKKILKKIEVLTIDPISGKKLEGEYQGLRSFKAWPFRIIYYLSEGTIHIVTIEHRQGVYK